MNPVFTTDTNEQTPIMKKKRPKSLAKSIKRKMVKFKNIFNPRKKPESLAESLRHLNSNEDKMARIKYLWTVVRVNYGPKNFVSRLKTI